MSTRCQIEFRSGNVRRTVYRHWDGYPSTVIPDLLAFLAWSERRGDVEYEAANFLYWSKREVGASEQLGFGVCANDELHGDIEYYYVVQYDAGACTISAHGVEREDGSVRVGRVVAVAPAPSSFSSATGKSAADRSACVARALPRVLLNGVWYFREDRLREFRRVDNPHERITSDKLHDTVFLAENAGWCAGTKKREEKLECVLRASVECALWHCFLFTHVRNAGRLKVGREPVRCPRRRLLRYFIDVRQYHE